MEHFAQFNLTLLVYNKQYLKCQYIKHIKYEKKYFIPFFVLFSTKWLLYYGYIGHYQMLQGFDYTNVNLIFKGNSNYVYRKKTV